MPRFLNNDIIMMSFEIANESLTKKKTAENSHQHFISQLQSVVQLT